MAIKTRNVAVVAAGLAYGVGPALEAAQVPGDHLAPISNKPITLAVTSTATSASFVIHSVPNTITGEQITIPEYPIIKRRWIIST